MGDGHGKAILAALGALLLLLLCGGGSARADTTPTQTILTGGVMRYQGTATADLNTSDANETNVDHAEGTFDESWLVSPYQTAATYRNSLSWSPQGSGSEHTRLVSGDGTVEDDFTCQYELAPDGNGTAGVDRTTHTLTATGLQGAVVDQPNADCTDHGIRQGDLRSLPIALSQGTAATMTLPAEPQVADTQTLPVSQSGTQSNGYAYQTTAQGTVTLSCALCVTAIDFRQPDIPGGGMEDVPDTGTYDGNQIEIDVTIDNRSTVDLTVPATLQVKDGPTLSSDQLVAHAGSTTKVIFTQISTQGFAWKDGSAQTKRTIQYVTPFGGGQRDLTVRPKPLILVHGLNSDAGTWSSYHDFATALHPNWDTFAVGDGQVPGTMDTDGSSGRSIADNALSEAQYIQGVRDKTDASHVDLVVHSMGGLISRQYIQANMPLSYDGKPVAAHLVMLGTPNQGSPCADLAAMLPGAGLPYLQLRPDWVNGVFDKTVTNARGVPFSVVAGNPLSFTCQSDDDPGDGVVEVTSAWYQYLDHGLTDLIHTSMTGSETLFDTFVKPHVAIGIQAGRGTAAASGTASAAADASAGDQQVAARQRITLGSGESGEIPIAVSGGTAGLTFVIAAPAAVAADLVDPSGAVAAHEDAGSDSAEEPIRTLRADSPAAGTWVLRLTQTGAGTATAAAVGALNGDPLRLAATATQPAGGGPVSVAATLTDAGSGVPGAAVTATVTAEDGTSVPLALRDAGGGRYSGATSALPAGYHLVVVQAEHAGTTRTTSTSAIAPAATGPAPGGTSTPPPSGGGAPTGGGPPSGGGTPTSQPKLVLAAGGSRRQSLRTGTLKVTCASKSAGTCRAQATVKVGHHRYRSKVAKAAARRKPRTLVLRFASKTLAAIRRAMRHHRLKATVTVSITRPGATAKATVVIRLRR